MKKILFFVLLAATICMLGSCGGNSKQVPFDDGDSLQMAYRDSTIYGICGEGTSMHMLQLITDTGDSLTIDVSDAQERNNLFGGLQVGDRMAVLPNADRTEALLVINESTLLGNWVMPNPLDGSDEIGFSIKEGGIAESIQQNGIVYKTWRMTYGRLELVLYREGSGEEDESYIYELVKLNDDSLVIRDGEDVFEYTRQKPKEEYGKDIILEESDISDFKI